MCVVESSQRQITLYRHNIPETTTEASVKTIANKDAMLVRKNMFGYTLRSSKQIAEEGLRGRRQRGNGEG